MRKVVFGGHIKWYKHISKRLPNVTFHMDMSKPNLSLVDKADMVFIYTYATRHGSTGAIIRRAKNKGIPFFILRHTSVDDCVALIGGA